MEPVPRLAWLRTRPERTWEAGNEQSVQVSSEHMNTLIKSHIHIPNFT